MTKMISFASTQGSAALFGGLVGRDSIFVRLVDHVLVWQQRATMRARLAELDRHSLADMGLAPAKALAEAGKPFWRA
jgi:uncharacterized protein YjiS (DUF1127 family)